MDPWFSMRLVDVNGIEHDLTCFHITMMLLVGWLCFLLSHVTNIFYYILHPSGIDLRLKHFPKRFTFYFCGFRVKFQPLNAKFGYESIETDRPKSKYQIDDYTGKPS